MPSREHLGAKIALGPDENSPGFALGRGTRRGLNGNVRVNSRDEIDVGMGALRDGDRMDDLPGCLASGDWSSESVSSEEASSESEEDETGEWVVAAYWHCFIHEVTYV